jgi:hypothetical protein
MFENLEKIEKLLYSPVKNLQMKAVVVLGSEGQGKRRLDAAYLKTYKSNKYSDYNEVNSLSLRTSDFLVFSYGANDVFEEVYMSYPHMEKLNKAFLAMKEALEDEELFIREQGEIFLNADFENFAIKIPNLAGGKSIVMTPNVVKLDDETETEGVIVYIGKENCYIEVTRDLFNSWAYYIENFNLSTTCQMLINFAAMHEISRNNSQIPQIKSQQKQESVVKPPERKVIKKTSSNPIKEEVEDQTKRKVIEDDEIPFTFSDEKEIKEKQPLISTKSLTKAMKEVKGSLFDEDDE